MSRELPLFGFGSGGSGGGLNFKLVGGVTQPAGPSANTIWVNTDEAITGYIFCSEAPEVTSADDGLVVILTGTASGAEFNALKKNTIMLYPTSVKQCINGVLTDVAAYIYMDGWALVGEVALYADGALSVPYTFLLTPENATGTVGDTTVVLKTVADKVSEAFICLGPLDLTYIGSIEMVYTLASAASIASDAYGAIFVAKEKVASYADAAAISENKVSKLVNNKPTADLTTSLNVTSLSGKYYVYFGTHTENSVWANQRTFTLKEAVCKT